MLDLDEYLSIVRGPKAESIISGLETILQNCKIDELKYSKSFLRRVDK